MYSGVLGKQAAPSGPTRIQSIQRSFHTRSDVSVTHRKPWLSIHTLEHHQHNRRRYKDSTGTIHTSLPGMGIHEYKNTFSPAQFRT